MYIVFLYMGLLFFGYFVGSRVRSHADKLGFMSKLLMSIVYVLVFIMGLRMGTNEQVTSNLGVIGLKAVIITICCVAGSMLAIFAMRKLVGLDRYGNVVKSQKAISNQHSEDIVAAYPDDVKVTGASAGIDEAEETGDSNFSSTIRILASVVVGMLTGYFLIAKYMKSIMFEFDTVTGNLLVIFLCVLLFVVGCELGLSGKVGESIKAAGIRVMVFPFAAIGGSLILGALCSLILGFTLKEGLAISAGFGWYTYAPTVIAEAGSQHMVASAVSFVHNVLRETSGIILIPVLAKKFGYIECTGVPGVAAMDICIPIVEKACRQDTIVYSFVIGVAMNIGTSILVPLFIM